MDFTDSYKQTGPCSFSPNSCYLAIAVDFRLVIRDLISLKIVQLYSCVDKISYIEWASDSEYILCGLYKRPMIQAWSLVQPEWTCKIDEGLAGITYARWSPDSRHILTSSEFQLRLTVWSLVNTACVHVQWPKHTSKVVSFTKDGKFAAICTRRDCKDYINLLSCDSWEIMGTFAIDTIDSAGAEWSPDDCAIVAWDSLLEYKVLIYSPDGRCLFKYQAYESGLGVKTVSWSSCGQFLAIGSYDQTVRVLNHLTWKVFAEFTHVPTIRGPCDTAIFKEVDEPWQLDMSDLTLSKDFHKNLHADNHEITDEKSSGVKYKLMNLPISLPSQKPAIDKPNPKQGIGLLSWSNNSRYLFSRNDSMPNVVWIWDIAHLALAAAMVQQAPIRTASWDPNSARLLLCTGGSHIYMWSSLGADCVNIPLPDFSAHDVKWNADGGRLLVKDNKESFCCAAVENVGSESTDDEGFLYGDCRGGVGAHVHYIYKEIVRVICTLSSKRSELLEMSRRHLNV